MGLACTWPHGHCQGIEWFTTSTVEVSYHKFMTKCLGPYCRERGKIAESFPEETESTLPEKYKDKEFKLKFEKCRDVLNGVLKPGFRPAAVYKNMIWASSLPSSGCL